MTRFPETPFVIGDGFYREYVKGDFCERLIKLTLDVGVDNPEAYAKLSAILKEEQYPPFFLFPLGDLLISQVDSHILWKEASGMENRVLGYASSTAYGINKPDEAMFKCFFDEAYYNEVASEIAREDAEWEAKRKAEWDALWEAKRSRGKTMTTSRFKISSTFFEFFAI